jgi:hypothetical protein
MITQEEILERLNQLTLRYNLTWRDVKYDADKAVIKINNFMGTVYPKMSLVLTHPQATYTFRSESIEVPYFPENYIHTVVIPYIASEVLARDEEFTTIYNKYMMEVEDGLFQMFQNEFNRVPLAYRQQPDQGVFFGTDTALSILSHNSDRGLPVYKFKVHYYVNEDAIVFTPGTEWIDTSEAFLYDEVATVRDFTDLIVFDHRGLYSYEFRGWTKDITARQTPTVAPGTTITMITDVHLYAVWLKTPTLKVNALGEVTMNHYHVSTNPNVPNITNLLTRLDIPEVYEGRTVRVLTGTAFNNQENLQEVYIPKTVVLIKTLAFNLFKGDTVLFDNSTTELITIETDAFANLENLSSIILPLTVTVVNGGAFTLGSIPFTFFVRRGLPLPDGWATSNNFSNSTNWYNGNNVTVVYNYNG